MQAFILRHYRILFGVLTALLVVCAFLTGLEEGSKKARQTVSISCREDVLSSLRMPLEDLVAQKNGNTDTTVSSTATESLIDDTARVAGAAIHATSGKYVGSKNGTKYYKPTCATVKRIKPENYIWFESEADAKLQGYNKGSC